MKTHPLILAATLLAAPALRAQLVNDGATRILSDATNILAGGLTVGTNGSFTLLVLSNTSLATTQTKTRSTSCSPACRSPSPWTAMATA